MGIISLEEATKVVNKYIGITRLPQRLANIQADIFSTHVKVEELIDRLIILKTLAELDIDLSDKNIKKQEKLLKPILDLNFSRKLGYIKDNQFLDTNDVEDINRLNDYRIEFAHKTRDYLINKYYGRVRRGEVTEIRKTLMSAPLAIEIEKNDLLGIKTSRLELEDEEIPF